MAITHVSGYAGAAPSAGDVVVTRRYQRAFPVVALAFLTVTAFSSVPSPLYGIYQARDGFSSFTITIIFAVYAVGIIAALLLAGHLSDIYGRRRLMLPAIGTAMVSAIVFLATKALPGLIVARLINGIAIGMLVTTATAYLTDLNAAARPGATPARAALAAGVANVGGLGIGAFVAGALAEWVVDPLTTVYIAFLVALALAAVGVALAPETREAATPPPPYRPQHLAVPPAERARFFAALLTTFMGFAAVGLFVGLAGLFLAVTLGHPSRALAGGTIGAMFASGVAAQFLTVRWSIRRAFEAGMGSMIIGVGLAVLAVWLATPSLGLFIAGGCFIGAGSGTILKGALGTVIGISPSGRTAESVTGLFVAAYAGISVPVVGAGIALARGVSPKVTILAFAIAVAGGIAVSAVKLIGRMTRVESESAARRAASS